MSFRDVAAVLLAGGRSSRLGLAYPKCLLPTRYGSLLQGSLATLKRAGLRSIIIVTPASHNHIQAQCGPAYRYVSQRRPQGNADALKVALAASRRLPPYLLVGMADSITLFSPQTITRFIRDCIRRQAVAGITVFKNTVADSIGRIYLDRQQHFLSVQVRREKRHPVRGGIPYLQGGYWFFKTAWLRTALPGVRRSPVSGEFNLTDILISARVAGMLVHPFVIRQRSEWSSVNTFDEYLETVKQIK